MSEPYQPDPSSNRSLLGGLRIVSLCTLASRVLGLLRDTAMAALFGAGPILDAFTVAFRVPNLARQLLGEGALTAAFLPAFVRTHREQGAVGAGRLTSATAVRLAGLLVGLVALAEIVIAILLWTTPLDSDARRMLHLLALFSPYLILVCMTALLCAVLQSLGRFFWPAILPVLLNLIWLVAVAVVPLLVTNPEIQVRTIALSLIVAGGLQLLAPVWILRRSGFHWSPEWRASQAEASAVFRSMWPVVAGVTLTQVNALVDSVLAWGLSLPSLHARAPWLPQLEVGTASAMYLGQRMYQFPLGVFGVALGTVLFPILTRHAEQGDRPRFREDLSLGVRLALAIGVPSSAGLMLIAGPLTTALFQYGKFDAGDAALTAGMIRAYGAAAWGFIVLLIANRGFYALEDRYTPVTIGKWAVAGNFVISLILIGPLGGAGLAWGTSIATMIQAVWTLKLLAKAAGGLDRRGLMLTATRVAIATLAMTGVILWLQTYPWPSGGLKVRCGVLLVQCLAGAGVYLIVAAIVRLKEPWWLIGGKLGDSTVG